ncbi:hypothetical protein Clacol_001674 [Clathrus columnatus]|uniref:JmjC domain-containing protein n=1 Tax=Clathrus columnatus TaxID=1419009 RepID=A0AAV4ZYR6_9AGAM|nr:hypothetical protein Clacol_001674 [Clathrus columnatus]
MNIKDLARIAQEYRELNPSSILVLDRSPSALEFARLIHIARPVLIKTGEVLYLQSQNGNLYSGSPSEFEPLLHHVPPEISWASEALGRSPDAVNLWIGDDRSTTSIHAEKIYPHARYTRSSSGSLALTPTSKVVRWSSIKDPSIPGVLSANPPYRIVVHAGDTLYLPPGWWHYVKQSVDETGICVALNWWYDTEMQGMNWIWLQYMRGTLGDGNDDESCEEKD